MTASTKTAVLIAGFALLGIVAVAGWTRQPVSANNNFTSPYTQQAYQPVYGPPADCVEPVYTNSAYAPAEYSVATRYRTYNRPRVVRTRYVEDRDVAVRTARRGRSTGKSVAIVAGSAAAGAGIGALTGGGKGAAIGALSGGAAGFLFDRLTHNR
ncbi:MAG TPA: hypothetical protein VEX68_30820 [Bryobacteraceae bacterium]|nr:hypothetical protein [Bryobacteraceae bacterium]